MTEPTIPHVPYPPEFEDLTPDQQTVLQNVSRFCLRKIGEAKTALNMALMRPNPRVMTHFKIEGVTLADKRDIRTILDRYNRMAGILLGHERVRFDGELTGPAFNLGLLIGKTIPAYVGGISPVRVGDVGEIKLVRDRFFASQTDSQARMMIHELGHRFLGLEDVKYYGESSAIRISRSDALRNADTYAHFAVPRAGNPSLRATR